ncbi:lamin tail domain-containing protein, partial [Akkermansiaceae bacterium]|nr:lamin tail domain-containing protein [Akkermansiaceae bacterium]
RGPLFFRGGSTILRDSFVDIPITGDGINIKGGYAETHRTTFLGNNSVDTDAIDYDGVINGVIKGCRIYNFRGFNSDGIDTGEQCVDVLIEGNSIFYNSDKGVSVGQGSTVIMRNNLVVGCLQGVGVKDSGSTILVDQNTFVDCAEAVSSFEKNFGKGGGSAIITNSIFSKCVVPVSFDEFSTLTVSYSLSDTSSLVGPNNLIADPLFVDAPALNFQLLLESPAKDSGDPAHALDPDATRADRGALYTYSSDDYPFETGKTVVINEILANSGPEPDWIELHNRSSSPVSIGGWFLSDDGSDLTKYRIPVDTVLPANGYLTFFEDTNFGPESPDLNRITGFGLSDNGETVHLTSAIDDVLTDYRFKENYGASLEGTTLGYYYKPGSRTYNFIALQEPTPAAPNAAPKIGPIIISEIMYNPSSSGATGSGTPIEVVVSILILDDFCERGAITIRTNRPWSLVAKFYPINTNVLNLIEIVKGTRAGELNSLATPRKFSGKPLKNASSFWCGKFRVERGKTASENNPLTRSHNERMIIKRIKKAGGVLREIALPDEGFKIFFLDHRKIAGNDEP